MIRVPNRGLHDLTSAPQALPIATVKRTYSKNVVPDVLSGKKPTHHPFFQNNNGNLLPANNAPSRAQVTHYSSSTASNPLCHFPQRGEPHTQPALYSAPAACTMTAPAPASSPPGSAQAP